MRGQLSPQASCSAIWRLKVQNMTFGVYVNHLRESPGQLQVAIAIAVAIPAMFYTNVDNDKYAHEPQPQTQTQTGTHRYSHYIQS